MSPHRTPPRTEVPIGRRRFLAVEAAAGVEDLPEPLYAVNLLDRRRPWAYELYGLLVLRPVLQAGARVVFKGHRLRVLLGAAGDTRETLLIVRYPHARAFLTMVRRPFFAAMSLFRRAGITGFRFGFARCTATEPTLPDRPRRYRGRDTFLLTTFDGGPPSLPAALADAAPGPFFAGTTVATLRIRSARTTGSRPTTLAPPLGWTGILVHQGSDAGLEALTRDRLAPLLADVRRAACTLYRRSL